jgi:putative peptide maturation system protein
MSIADALARAAQMLVGPLSRIAGDQPGLEDVKATATTLARELPELRIRIMRLPGAYGANADVFAMVTAPGTGTVLLGAAADDRTPWPLRGLRHADEAVALRVDGEVVTFEDVAIQLDRLWDDGETLARIVDARIIANEIASRTIEVTYEELQQGVDAFRAELGLFSEEQTRVWLEARGWSMARLEDHVSYGLQAGKLRAIVVSDDEAMATAQQTQQYRRVSLVEAIFDSRDAAETTAQAVASGRSLIATAYDVGTGLRTVRSRILAWYELVDEERAIAERMPSVGTIRHGIGSRCWHRVVHVQEIAVPSSGQAVLRAARDRCFASWLKQRRAMAHVQWLWGHATTEDKR